MKIARRITHSKSVDQYCCTCQKVPDNMMLALIEHKSLHWYCLECETTDLNRLVVWEGRPGDSPLDSSDKGSSKNVSNFQSLTINLSALGKSVKELTTKVNNLCEDNTLLKKILLTQR